MLAHVSQIGMQEDEIDPRISREGVRGQFAGCSFPEILLAMQELREMQIEMLDGKEGRKQCWQDKAEFQKIYPGKLIG